MRRKSPIVEGILEWQGTLLSVEHFNPVEGRSDGTFEIADLQDADLQEALNQLEHGQVGTCAAGPLTLSLRYVPPVSAPPRKPIDVRPFLYVAATMAAAGVFLALLALVPPPGHRMTIPPESLASRLVPFTTEPVQIVPEEGQRWDEEHGGQWGRAGLSGVDDASRESRRRTERRSESLDVRASARRQGVLSLGSLFEGLGASDSPFREAIGQSEDALLGHLTGTQVGEAFGFGGIAMIDRGRYGGGRGLGTVPLRDRLGGGGAGWGTVCGCMEMGTIGRGSGFGTIGTRGERVDAQDQRTSRAPRLRAGRPEVRGSLDPALIRRVVRRHVNETRHCYSQALQDQPELQGRVEARFVVLPSGEVSAASLASSTLDHAQVESCVLDVVRRMVFPAAPGGNISVVNYPWSFVAL